MRNLFILLFVGIFSIIAFNLNAVPAYPYPITITQPDGSKISVILRGDENFHYHTTTDGYPLIKNETGTFDYAKIDASGNLSDSKIKASNIEKRTKIEKDFLSNVSKADIISFSNNTTTLNKVKSLSNQTIEKPQKFPLTGSPRSLVILVNFSDKSFVVSNPKTAFTNLLNQEGYSENEGTGSAKDYFRDNSMTTFNPQFDVVGPYTLPHNYSYYGKNDSDGNDQDPVQMVVDACTLASQNGVDFSIYDTDNNGYVDNIFIYYAGYNEAEGGPDDTVWPHRWIVSPGYNYSGNNASITFSGVKIYDYACTSELKGRMGSTMCGIGTFCHEFGHVLGLVDFYATDGSTHHTLSDWDIMDYGPYLNSGRTPPAYSSHERFYLGWLTPIILNSPQNDTLPPITTSNKAYIITQNGTSNLNGSNPSPSEYFMLENRQNIGWDTYLPGHGMLISRIYYNATTWNNNTANNISTSMGDDIIEADGIADDNTLAGDPFPGTSGVTSYTPTLRSGTVLSNKPITFIQESGKIINFKFMGGNNPSTIITSGSFSPFLTIQGTPSEAQTITISGKKLVSDITVSLSNGTNYEIKKETDPDTYWGENLTLTQSDSIVQPTNIMVRYNPIIPSYNSTQQDSLILQTNNTVSIELSLTGQSSRQVYIVPPVALDATDITYGSFIANWQKVLDNDRDAAGYYVTIYSLENTSDTTFIQKDKWLTKTTSDSLYNLVSDRDYYYYVKASDKNTTYGYENITAPSNTIKVHTLPYTSEKDLRVTVDQKNGNILVFVPKISDVINIYNTIGQRIMSVNASSEIVNLNMLPKNQVYIIQSGKLRTKILW